MFFLILLAQFLGALLGVLWSWLVIMPSYLESDVTIVPPSWVTPLCPVGVTDIGTIEEPCDLD